MLDFNEISLKKVWYIPRSPEVVFYLLSYLFFQEDKI